jgi:hypothetical protein
MLRFLTSIVMLARALLKSRRDLALENLALRQQLAVLKVKTRRPRLRPGDRLLWVLLRRLWPKWSDALIIVKARDGDPLASRRVPEVLALKVSLQSWRSPALGC